MKKEFGALGFMQTKTFVLQIHEALKGVHGKSHFSLSGIFEGGGRPNLRIHAFSLLNIHKGIHGQIRVIL